MSAGLAIHQKAGAHRARESPPDGNGTHGTPREEGGSRPAGRGCTKCEQKGCEPLVKHKGGAGSDEASKQLHHRVVNVARTVTN